MPGAYVQFLRIDGTAIIDPIRVTPQNIWDGVTDYRNPLVAEIMHHLGYVQRFGLGLPLTQQSLRDNGNPPAEFEFQSSGILVTLRPSP